MMWYYGGDGWNWLWTGGMMVLWGGVILLMIRTTRGFSFSNKTGDAATETLRMRLAAGEISPEDFEKTEKAMG